MAWFHKTLTEMKVLIELELKKPNEERDWTKVKAILKDHQKLRDWSEGDLRTAKMAMESYEEHLSQVNILVNRKNLVGLEADGVITECNEAIGDAKVFEDAINRLIADEKFLEE